jgi:predicted O-methyltransferase YrrM
MVSTIKRLWHNIRKSPESFHLDFEEFSRRFSANMKACDWEMHPLYSVFTQYDQEYYLRQREAFIQKYRSFYAVSKTISPRAIIELGTCAGSSADAYLSAAPGAKYTGLDVYGENFRHDDHTPWKPLEIAHELFAARGFKNYELVRVDLRTLSELPSQADLVVVDAAHDFDNEYADLRLALTAHPTYIFVDDADDENGAKPAIEKFLKEDVAGRVEYTFSVPYIGGGLVIRLKN